MTKLEQEEFEHLSQCKWLTEEAKYRYNELLAKGGYKMSQENVPIISTIQQLTAQICLSEFAPNSIIQANHDPVTIYVMDDTGRFIPWITISVKDILKERRRMELPGEKFVEPLKVK